MTIENTREMFKVILLSSKTKAYKKMSKRGLLHTKIQISAKTELTSSVSLSLSAFVSPIIVERNKNQIVNK